MSKKTLLSLFLLLQVKSQLFTQQRQQPVQQQSVQQQQPVRQQPVQQQPSTPFQCIRSPTVGSPINYIHKALEQVYQKLHAREVSAIPRMILDYTELGSDLQHYGWYFPQAGQNSMLYLSMGNIRAQRASMENFFYTEVNESSDPNASYNQVLKVLKATKLDRSTNQPMPFVLDKNSTNISEYTVNCGNIKGSFIDFQRRFTNQFPNIVRNFS